jgi:hypothetical protein
MKPIVVKKANITAKSWTFILSVLPNRLNQDSPLRLASREDALVFGKRMFEPPLSVVKWSVVGSMDSPNFPFQKIASH